MSSARHAAAGSTDRRGNGGSSLLNVAKTISRLAPKQLNDEIALAKLELKRKGIGLGFAAAFFAVALVLLCFMLVALIVAGIMGLATIMPAWLAALLVAAFFLLLLLIFALIGLVRLKKVMPLKPEHAMKGLRYDAGIAKSGAAFDPKTLEKPKLNKAEAKAQKAQKKAEAEKAKAKRTAKELQNGPPPTEGELLERTAARRNHLLKLRSQLLEKADVRAKARMVAAKVQERAAGLAGSAAEASSGVAGTVRERWLPLSVLALAATAAVVFLRRLLRP